MSINNLSELKKRNYFLAVKYAYYKVLLAIRGIDKRYSSYYFNIFYFVDVLANALTAGHPDVTVSGRVGYYSYHYNVKRKIFRPYWKLMGHIIDFTFKPLDGEDHCRKAYKMHIDDFNKKLNSGMASEIKLDRGRIWLLYPLSVIIVFSCLIFIPFTYTLGKKIYEIK